MATSILRASSKPPTCPTCGSKVIAEIQYGLPAFIDLEAIESGRIVMGGCCLTGDDPLWRCVACDQPIHAERTTGLVAIEVP